MCAERAWRVKWTARYRAIAELCVIQKVQKRVAYFDCTAAPGDSCGAPSRAALPSSSSPASPARPRWHHGMAGAAGWRRSSGGWTRRRSAHRRRSHCRPSGVVLARQPPGVDLSFVNPEALDDGARGIPNCCGKSRGWPPAGTEESRRPGTPNIFPLLTRLSSARSTSAGTRR
jgi:hypothetical protein